MKRKFLLLSLLVTIISAWTLLGLNIAAAQPYVYVANYDSNNISVIDTASNTVVSTVPVGSNSGGVAITPDGTRAYVTYYTSNKVWVIDTATNTVVATVSVRGGLPTAVAFTPDGTRAYVTSGSSDYVSVIDTASSSVVMTIGVEHLTSFVAITPDGAYAYLLSGSDILVLDTASSTVVATVPVVGASLLDVAAITPDGTRAYVTNYTSNSVLVLDTASNTVVATVPVGSNPGDVAIMSKANEPPVADAGPDQMVHSGTVVTLNGSSTAGGPDKNDWIASCAAQDQVYSLIIKAINFLKLL